VVLLRRNEHTQVASGSDFRKGFAFLARVVNGDGRTRCYGPMRQPGVSQPHDVGAWNRLKVAGQGRCHRRALAYQGRHGTGRGGVRIGPAAGEILVDEDLLHSLFYGRDFQFRVDCEGEDTWAG